MRVQIVLWPFQYTHMYFFVKLFFGAIYKILSQRYIDWHKTPSIYLLAVGVKGKDVFLVKYFTARKSSTQSFPRHKRRVEITTIDRYCQLLFHNFEAFLPRHNLVKTLLSGS